MLLSSGAQRLFVHSVYMYVFTYIYIYVCVCVCVCVLYHLCVSALDIHDDKVNERSMLILYNSLAPEFL
jgi:hypothetical protein